MSLSVSICINVHIDIYIYTGMQQKFGKHSFGITSFKRLVSRNFTFVVRLMSNYILHTQPSAQPPWWSHPPLPSPSSVLSQSVGREGDGTAPWGRGGKGGKQAFTGPRDRRGAPSVTEARGRHLAQQGRGRPCFCELRDSLHRLGRPLIKAHYPLAPHGEPSSHLRQRSGWTF